MSAVVPLYNVSETFGVNSKILVRQEQEVPCYCSIMEKKGVLFRC